MATQFSTKTTTTDANQQQYSPNRTYCCCIPTRWRKIPSSSDEPSSHQSNPAFWSRGITALKKLREWSEIVAGPKWKTFIRRFNYNKHSSYAKYQYDPQSYALNFDQDPLQTTDPETENEYLIRNFSSRYVMPPSSVIVPVSGPNFV
uniref:uncharacterized protein LOC122589795 n=1 Tax=Erigeron canadensis TaxID=72917 RepID=UPI001CB8EDF9|nr:uncharacterized protein LOC122589795 [Erigeron canadensis]